MIKWIDKRSVLRSGNKVYKAGDAIPADMLSRSRVDYLLDVRKVEIEKQEKVHPEKSEKRGRPKKEKQVETEIFEPGVTYESSEE